jgi:hypothetical protein
MKSFFLLSLFTLFVNAASVASADQTFSGDNFSGVYVCKGNNNKVGDYEVMATLKLNRHSSQDNFGAYDLTTETENALVYKGQAIAQGHKLALTFNFSDGRNPDFTTGIANIDAIAPGRWAYRNYYYEPDGVMGVFGTERCVMKVSSKRKNKKKAVVKQPVLNEESANTNASSSDNESH